MSCKILTYKEIDRSEWSKLVRESRTGTWFQSPSAYEFFAGQPKLFAPFVVAVRDERLGIRGICVGYVTIEKSVLKQFFTRRAIILGGPVCADDATSEEVEFLMDAVRQRLEIGHWRLDICKDPIYIETRNFEDYSRWREAFEAAGFEYKKHLNFHVDCTDEEAMWGRLSENRRRQLKKSAAISELAISELEIREWYGILERLYKTKVKTPLWPVEFFLEAYRQGVGKFLLVKHEEKVIGGSMVVVKKPTSDSSLKGRGGDSFASVWGSHTADSIQYDLLKTNAIANRKAPTEAEAIMWRMLKGNNLGLHFRRQHIILDYIVDFVCIEKGLVIELDGCYHNDLQQKEYDEQRTVHLQKLGYTELRFTNEELLVNPEEVIAKIKAVAEKLPSLKGRTEDRLGVVYEWFECGMNAEYKEQYPSVMATWAGMKLAHEMGCARYDMMGAGEPGVPYGVRDFKSEFGGELVEQGRFLCVTQPILYKLGVFAVRLLKCLK